MNDSIAALEIVAKGLDDMLPSVVFVGGATCALFMDGVSAENIRPTDDVDCIVEVASPLDFAEFEEKLSQKGFSRASDSGVICRWRYKGIVVDLMPTDSKIIGFSNSWYAIGVKEKQFAQLPNGIGIFILKLPIFLATKLEALNTRGKGKDWRIQKDLEDILLVCDGSKDPVSVIKTANPKVQQYLCEQFRLLSARPDYDELLFCYLGEAEPGRVKRMKDLIARVIESI